MGVIAIILNVIGLPLGFVYETMGVLIGSAVVPIASCLLWRKTPSTNLLPVTHCPVVLHIGSIQMAEHNTPLSRLLPRMST